MTIACIFSISTGKNLSRAMLDFERYMGCFDTFPNRLRFRPAALGRLKMAQEWPEPCIGLSEL